MKVHHLRLRPRCHGERGLPGCTIRLRALKKQEEVVKERAHMQRQEQERLDDYHQKLKEVQKMQAKQVEWCLHMDPPKDQPLCLVLDFQGRVLFYVFFGGGQNNS